MASEGDPRVLFVMNLALSFTFAAVVVWGFGFLGIVEGFSWPFVAVLTAVLMALTYLVVW